ncbi:MAG: hypothetical protein DRI73_00225 [Bacteroidetes bacterium]|nr:MAG: hypothetical protein DRI73_00225 [Bacteroidota bacterium]
MKKTIFILILAAIIINGCNKNDNDKTSGENSLNSELILSGQTYSIQGFSFESGSVILYNPASSTSIPDIFALPDTDPQNNEVTAYLDTENPFESFALAGTFPTSGEALDFYNNYKEVKVSTYVSFAKPVLENQVWVFKTRNNKYAKMLIMKVNTSIKNQEPYAEVTFKWAYQPDGSTIFP